MQICFYLYLLKPVVSYCEKKIYMALIYCRECGNQISQQAKSCPNCGEPLKKSKVWIFILIVIIILGSGGGYFYWKLHDDRTERIAVATEILKNNRDDIIGIATQRIKKNWIKTIINIAADQGCDCIIDSLAVRLADKHTLSELNDLKIKPASNIIEVTKLVTENEEVCKECLSFKIN